VKPELLKSWSLDIDYSDPELRVLAPTKRHVGSGNEIEHDASGKKGILSCCKCLFEKIGANLAQIQAEKLQNVRFWQMYVFGKNFLESMG